MLYKCSVCPIKVLFKGFLNVRSKPLNVRSEPLNGDFIREKKQFHHYLKTFVVVTK